MTQHFVEDFDLTAPQQAHLLQSAARLKQAPHEHRHLLAGKTLAMIFAKSSTRTRVSFEAGIYQLGGHAIMLPARDNQMGRGESIEDTAKVLSSYVDLIMIRTFAHDDVLTLAAHSRVPVINGLDDVWHPCQALADLLTVQECRGALAGCVLAYIGDGNNVAHSLMAAGALAGVQTRVICPKNYLPDAQVVARAKALGNVEVTHDLAAVDGADVVYTDVWTSMGQEIERTQRLEALAPLQVNANVMRRAKPDAIFLHCLPAHRGEEVTADVIDGRQSEVFRQAENRLHAQKALMIFLSLGTFA